MDTSNTNNAEHLTLGYKVIDYALKLLAWGTVVAVTWSCSTLLMGIIMFIVVGIIMSLLQALLGMLIMFKVPTTSVETLGRTVGGVTGRVSSLFARKPAAV